MSLNDANNRRNHNLKKRAKKCNINLPLRLTLPGEVVVPSPSKVTKNSSWVVAEVQSGKGVESSAWANFEVRIAMAFGILG